MGISGDESISLGGTSNQKKQSNNGKIPEQMGFQCKNDFLRKLLKVGFSITTGKNTFLFDMAKIIAQNFAGTESYARV